MSNDSQKKPTALPGLVNGLLLIFLALILFIVVLVILLIAGAGLILVGRILSQFSGLGLFEASLVVLGAAFIFVYAFVQIWTMPTRDSASRWDDVLDDLDEEEDEFEDEFEDEILPPPSRNDLCPCGSGRKYKNCHGR
jgi:hypothetical protein